MQDRAIYKSSSTEPSHKCTGREGISVDNMNAIHTVDDIDTVLLLKVKLEESALVINVNKNRCSLKSILLGVNWYTLLSKKELWMQCQRNYLEIGLLGTSLEIIVWSSKRSIYSISRTNYTANLYSATILLMS